MNLIPTYNDTKDAVVYTWGILYLFMRFNMKHAGDYVNDFKKTFLQNAVHSETSRQVDNSTEGCNSTEGDTTTSTTIPQKEFNHSEDSAFKSVKQSKS